MPLLFILSTAAFVSAFSIRVLDPLVPSIARDLGVTIAAAAMLAPAYTFPYALSQPLLGGISDQFGKERTIRICTALLAMSLAVATVASDYTTLFIARVMAGLSGGGMIPVAFAIIGDRFEVAQRQVALARVVMASQIAILLSSGLSGLIAARFGWRVVFGVAGAVVLVSFVMMLRGLPNATPRPAQRISFSGMGRIYLSVFRSPMARFVLPAAAVEGIALFGLMPFVAHRLEVRGLGGMQEAGLVLAGMSIGGITFTLLVGRLLQRFGRARLIRAGGVISCGAYFAMAAAQSWQVEGACFAALGFGFFMIHNSLQLLATELVPEARSSSIAMFAFCFFLGQALGPVLYHAGFEALGNSVPLLLAGSVLLAMALAVGAILDRKPAPTG